MVGVNPGISMLTMQFAIHWSLLRTFSWQLTIEMRTASSSLARWIHREDQKPEDRSSDRIWQPFFWLHLNLHACLLFVSLIRVHSDYQLAEMQMLYPGCRSSAWWDHFTDCLILIASRFNSNFQVHLHWWLTAIEIGMMNLPVRPCKPIC